MDEILEAQERLSRALGRARMGEDRELANQVRGLGERLAHLFSGLLKITRLHAPDNRAFDKPVADLAATLAEMQELLGTVHLVSVEDQVYVNDIRIRAPEKTTAIAELGAELQRHNVGGITFHVALREPQIRNLLGCLGGGAAASSPRASLTAALQARGVSGIDLTGRFRFRMAGEPLRGERREAGDARDLVSRAAAAVDEAFQNLAAGRVPNPLPLRRLVSELLGEDLGGEDLWCEASGAPPHVVHALRVTHLALVLGRTLSLSDGQLQDLGVAALYHDAGYAGGDGEAVTLERHAALGSRLMLRQKGFHEAKLRRVVALLQHHRDANDAGGPPSLFARILRIAEDYDALARRAPGIGPARALALMLPWAGSRYDPVLLQLFQNALGAYPPGTLLQLEDGRVFRSISQARGAQTFAAPLARCIRLADGQPVDPIGPVVDLAGAGRLKALRPPA